MGKLGQNTFNKKVIDAFVSTPLIILAPTKRKRKSAAGVFGIAGRWRSAKAAQF